MSDSVDQLSSMTGIPRADMLDMFAQVKANNARLESCAWHEFELLSDGKVSARRRYRCVRCGGEIDGHAHFWHEKGRRPQDAESGARSS